MLVFLLTHALSVVLFYLANKVLSIIVEAIQLFVIVDEDVAFNLDELELDYLALEGAFLMALHALKEPMH